jgi:hypothetical protein
MIFKPSTISTAYGINYSQILGDLTKVYIKVLCSHHSSLSPYISATQRESIVFIKFAILISLPTWYVFLKQFQSILWGSTYSTDEEHVVYRVQQLAPSPLLVDVVEVAWKSRS